MMLSLYRAATTLGGPLIRGYINRRLARGKEDPERLGERFGRPGRARPAGPLIWVHAASVGESLSMLPLVDRLLAAVPHGHVLVTSGTVTSARLMAARLPDRALHQYVPIDRVACVRPFLDHWRPDLALWAESELWPNLLLETAARGVPMALINGRMSSRSFARWHRMPGTIGRLLGPFAICLGQTDRDAERFRQLGAVGATSVGNLKFAAPPLPVDAQDLAALRAAIADRPVWLAASTHAGEEALAGRVHRRLQATLPALLSIVVPRHPGRGAEIAATLRGDGFVLARRGADEPLDAETEIYLADTMGELGLFYRLAEIAFVGKSLAGRGGQNPLEPARLGRAVLFGPQMQNFAEMADRMLAAGAALEVADEADLARIVDRLLGDSTERRRLAAAAGAFAEQEAHVLDAVMTVLDPVLGPLRQSEADRARA